MAVNIVCIVRTKDPLVFTTSSTFILSEPCTSLYDMKESIKHESTLYAKMLRYYVHDIACMLQFPAMLTDMSVLEQHSISILDVFDLIERSERQDFSYAMTRRQLSMIRVHFTNKQSYLNMRKESKRRHDALVFFNKYNAKAIVKYDKAMQSESGDFVFQPWHHIIITRDNRLVVYVWDTRKVEAVLDKTELVDNCFDAKSVDNYEPILGYNRNYRRASDF